MPGTETNYTPTPYGTFVAPAVTCIHGNCVGNGVPSNSIGFDGFTYINEVAQELYLKINGAWVLHATSGGGGAGLTYYQGAFLDPNGNQIGNIGDVYHSRTSLGGDSSTWWKVSGNGTNTVWE